MDELSKKRIATSQTLEASTISFEELFNIDEIQRIQDEFSLATGVASIITRTDGTPITRPSNFTDLCSNIIRKTEKGCANCIKSDAAIGRYYAHGAIVQPCLSGGLWDAGASITVGGQHIANWLIGQVRDETQTEEKMRAYAREIGVDEPSFIEAFRKVPAMSQHHFQHIAQALFTLANQLSSTAYQNIQQARFIAERQQAEAALRESEWKFKAMVETLPLAICLSVGLEQKSEYANHKFIEMFGYTLEDIPSVAQWWPLAYPDETYRRQVSEEWTARVKRAVETKSSIEPMETEVLCKNGSKKTISWSFIPLGDKNYSCGLDLTERKRAEAELQKMMKLTSIGTLAGGIAHDFNNILMGLFGNISLAKSELSKNHSAFVPLGDAEKSMERAIRLTNQLLTFAKGGAPVKAHISLGGLLEEIAQFDLSGSNVMLIYKQSPDLWMAKADKGQIQQAISNLTIHARQAMPDGGHLYITLENVEIQKGFMVNLQPGKHIKITMRDEGRGIDPKSLDRVFDPYFTTEQGGSGLELATAYSIINKHGGHIGVESELGKGTTFTIYLPATKAQALAPQARQPGLGLSPFGQAPKILVMDDEEVIRMLIPRWLKRAGCTVETSADGRHAIDTYKQSLNAGEPFDVVILDLTIPGGIGGQEALKEILALDPNAKGIVSSGYAESAVMSNYASYGFKGVLAKPYTESQLRDVLAQVLK